jgi:type I restriction enzyme S subunit
MSNNTKPSGIEWVRDIPSDWEVGRIKYCYDIVLGKMLQPIQERNTDKEMYYMCSVNVTWDGINLSTLKQMWFTPSEVKMYLLQKGDLLVTEGGDIAIACIWNDELQECCIQNALHLIRSNGKHLNKFLYYWLYFLKHTGYIDLICNKATIAHFTKEKFGESPVCVVSLKEQKAIATFLDTQCGKIDNIITDLEQQIEILKQYKTSLITETVTKGLNKDAPMKDSGIDWIGKIPSHWEVNRLRYRCKLKTGTTPSGNEGITTEKTDYYWYTPGDFSDLLILEQSGKYINCETIKKNNIIVFPSSSILLVTIGTVGKIGFSSGESYSNQQITAIMPKNMENKYLLYFLVSQTKNIKENALYTTLPIINNSYLSNIQICVPSLSEQQTIAAFLDGKCKEISSIITEKQQSIDAMKAYKKSLIYEYVTGKKRVKGYS